MTSPIAFLILAAAAQTSAPPLVLPPHSVPPEAMQPAAAVSAPQERGAAQSYFTPYDYPAEAVGTKAQGTVRFSLTIDPTGRVVGCNITQSSGSGALDRATCTIIHRRARFTPAMDASGNPVVGTIEQTVVWKGP